MRILNLHGFGGATNNFNFKIMKDVFPDADIMDECNDYLGTSPRDIINWYGCYEQFDIVIGNSFGGFLAYIIGTMVDAKTFLTNPCIPASMYMPDNYEYTKELESLWEEYKGRNHNCYAIIGLQNKILNPQKAIEALGGANITLVPDAEHHISPDIIEKWIRNHTRPN